MGLWDTWFLAHEGEVHMVYIQRLREGSERLDGTEEWLGHAVSADLIHWQELPPALPPGPQGTADDLQPWTGCLVEHSGGFYLYYTMRSSNDDGKVQAIGLATSDDLTAWQRYPGNPVIEPDPRWYVNRSQPAPTGRVDCRDLIVVRDEAHSGWLGFYSARTPLGPGNETAETGVVACVRSTDLIHWEHLPPAFAPRKYACLEVPDVFALDGRWYMTCMTGHYYGNRGIFTDPRITNGTIYAVADEPAGPYRELSDNVLIGAGETNSISCRSVELEGTRYLLYTQMEKAGRSDGGAVCFGTLTTPKVLRTAADGRLLACYSDRIGTVAGEELILDWQRAPDPWRELDFSPGEWRVTDSGCQGAVRSGWGRYVLSEPVTDNFILTARLTMETGVAAGIVFRHSDAEQSAAVVLDFQAQEILYTELPVFAPIEARKVQLEHGNEFLMRVVAKGEFIEVYLDEVLILHVLRYGLTTGRVGFLVDRGKSHFHDIHIHPLRMK